MITKVVLYHYLFLFLTISLFNSCTKDDGFINSSEIEKWTYYNSNNGLPSNVINCIVEDNEHNIWIGTKNGLMKYNGTSFTNYPISGILPSSNILGLYWSKNNVLYIGTDNGASKISLSKYSTIFTNCECYSFCEDNSGIIYCASNYGMITINFEKILLRTFDTETNNNYIFDIACDNNNQIWLAAPFYGIYKINNSGTKYFKKETIGIKAPAKLYKDKIGNIWIGSYYGYNMLIYDGSTFKKDTIFTDYEDFNNYKSFTQDRYGNFWISISPRGVFNYAGKMTKVYNKVNSKISSNDINSIYCASDGSIWFGSENDGLIHLENIKPLQFEFGPAYKTKTSLTPTN